MKDHMKQLDNLNYIGNCTDDDVIEHIFGDVTGFAQAVEEYGDEFVLDDLVVKYDSETDVHSFYYKKNWTIDYIRDGLALSTEVTANSLSDAFIASFDMENDPSIEVFDVYMADRQEKPVFLSK